MRINELLNKACLRANVVAWTGASTNRNLLSSCVDIVNQTLKEITNDPTITLFQTTHDYPENLGAVASTYELPDDYSYATMVIRDTQALTKTNYAELIRQRQSPFLGLSYAINDNKLELVWPAAVKLVYSRKLKNYGTQEDIDIPEFALDFVVNAVAFNIALVHNQEAVQRCMSLMNNSKSALTAHLAVDTGDITINQFETNVRFNSGWIGNPANGAGGGW